jgi:NTP pyrophosphatase (non-canonical NTP hydrolase)
MQFNEYQDTVSHTAVYPNVGDNYTYPMLGLAGEAGETAGALAEMATTVAHGAVQLLALTAGLAKEGGDVAEAIKKLERDMGGVVNEEKREQVKKELGDVLWYIASLAREFNLKLDDVAQANVEKLFGRRDRGTLHGSGDDR